MTLTSKHIFKNAINLPNFISLFRLLLAIPFYFSLSNLHVDIIYRYVVFGLIILAFITDILDGYIARKKKIITEFGKIIDPFADKVLVISIVTMLYVLDELPAIYFWIIIGRDIIIFIGGILVSKKIGKVLPSNLLGKITVLIIGFFIIATIADLAETNFIYRFLFYFSIIMSFASVVAYALRAYEFLKWKNDGSVQKY